MDYRSYYHLSKLLLPVIGFLAPRSGLCQHIWFANVLTYGVCTVQEQECLAPGRGFLPTASGLCGHNRPEAQLQQTDRGEPLQD